MSRISHNDQRSLLAPDRLAWRLPEWMKLTGTSRPTLWRQIKRGDLKIVSIGSTRMVPRCEAIRLGLIKA
ncbi:putative DNA-binding transcriptional regulator AlpA [Nitrobacteraceae bacterium AZCC 2146]